ncbi:hypothetical protein U9M48_013521 [Paspalum notatum var. saurae]|uniref:Uncharacterized protein n=1 Tax=Paspalum notatum var. saurae TaxID=547442 RepID=A0AAQ3SZM5_PASNO
MVVPSLNCSRQVTPDPLSALALLEDKQNFKFGGVDGRNLAISTVNYQPNGAMQVGRHRPGRPTYQQGRLTLTQAAQPPN